MNASPNHLKFDHPLARPWASYCLNCCRIEWVLSSWTVSVCRYYLNFGSCGLNHLRCQLREPLLYLDFDFVSLSWKISRQLHRLMRRRSSHQCLEGSQRLMGCVSCFWFLLCVAHGLGRTICCPCLPARCGPMDSPCRMDFDQNLQYACAALSARHPRNLNFSPCPCCQSVWEPLLSHAHWWYSRLCHYLHLPLRSRCCLLLSSVCQDTPATVICFLAFLLVCSFPIAFHLRPLAKSLLFPEILLIWRCLHLARASHRTSHCQPWVSDTWLLASAPSMKICSCWAEWFSTVFPKDYPHSKQQR